MKLFNKRTKIYFFGIILIVGLFYLLFNDFGFYRYQKLSNEIDELNSRIENLQNENKKLKDQIDSIVRKEPSKIEKIAREKYDMIRPGETKIEVIEK
ncbi:MAG TPA: septum formation initiator family protein [Ignavibacteriaceae bacterium]|nr:septum formation initiator family protein [Ignavibacteriaceae bacterium]